MGESDIISKRAVEELLSRLNARLADAMDLLLQSTQTLGRSWAILSVLETEVEEIYLSLSGEEGDETQTENNAC